MATPKASIDARLDTAQGRCIITSQNLDVQEITSFVAHDSAGATAIFVGNSPDAE